MSTTPREIAEGILGAFEIAGALVTPSSRDASAMWGTDAADAERVFPGDALVPAPSWSWTHAIAIDAPPAAVWPWVAQIGQDKAGFYSYEVLENLGGCGIDNADTIRPEWAVKPGDVLRMHPKIPPIPVRAIEPGAWFVASSHAADEPAPDGKPDVRVSWLFLVEPLDGGQRSRFVSRWRSIHPDTLGARLAYGDLLTGPIGNVMDKRMLEGVKERAERRVRAGFAQG